MLALSALWRALAVAVALAAWWRVARGGGSAGSAVALSVAAMLLWWWLARARRRERLTFIGGHALPGHLDGQLAAQYPSLNAVQRSRVERGLRQFFRAHLQARRGFIGMPSKVADALWHAFILDTRAYAGFCARAFGGFLHHRPAETLGRDAGRNDGLRRTWFWCCKDEGIDPRKPSRLPLLFALDGELAIDGGFRYVPDCRAIGDASGSGAYCGGDFGSDSAASGDGAGFGGEAGGDGGSGGGDAGGSGSDGGNGGGGGCGGGGD